MKIYFLIVLAFLCISPTLLLADTDDAPTAYAPGKELFGTLNYRSEYLRRLFSEPFRVEDTAIDNELRFDWEHDQAKGSVGNTESAEIQKSFNIFTFEIQANYSATTGGIAADSDDTAAAGRSAGFGNVELAARLPLYQYLSKTASIDNSVGFNLETAIPTNTYVSKNAGISPGLFDDLAIGEHFSVQSLFAFTHTFGDTQTGRASFQYELAFGYAIEDEDFKIPLIDVTPDPQRGTRRQHGSTAGHNALTGTASRRAEFKTVGIVQPSFGVGYIFPIDGGGRDELGWGIITSATFEF